METNVSPTSYIGQITASKNQFGNVESQNGVIPGASKDIILDIFSKLGVADLHRFRLINKQWKKLSDQSLETSDPIDNRLFWAIYHSFCEIRRDI